MCGNPSTTMTMSAADIVSILWYWAAMGIRVTSYGGCTTSQHPLVTYKTILNDSYGHFTGCMFVDHKLCWCCETDQWSIHHNWVSTECHSDYWCNVWREETGETAIQSAHRLRICAPHNCTVTVSVQFHRLVGVWASQNYPSMRWQA